MEALKGRRILGLFLSKDHQTLFFLMNEKDQNGNFIILFEVEGDCCSRSYYADIQGVDALIGAELDDFEILDETSENAEYDGQIITYGIKLKTDRGYATITYRNDNNGYYSGWMNPPLHSSELPANLIEIRDDWSL